MEVKTLFPTTLRDRVSVRSYRCIYTHKMRSF